MIFDFDYTLADSSKGIIDCINYALKELGLNPVTAEVLVTCDSDNIASARIIQKNGGVLENEVISDELGKPVSRYWIQL